MAYGALSDKDREAIKALALELYTVKQVACLFDVTERTVANWVRVGRLKGVKIGGKWRFTRAEIERFASGK